MRNKKTRLGCTFERPMFGANYPDGTCIDGYMWDLDSCDEPGGGLTSGGDIPCPYCNTREHLEYQDKRFSGNARQRRRIVRIETARIKRRAAEWA